MQTYASDSPEAERAFFRRFATRHGQKKTIELPELENRELALANRLAEDRATITHRGDQLTAHLDDFFDLLPKKQLSGMLQELDEEFTEDEVRRAIKSCPRGKAAGPDGIPNDWYRDNEARLAEVLTPLMNKWHSRGQLPPTFTHAAVACIPKTSAPRTGLDFRPIALLDTDYKIYSRLLLNRVRDKLEQLVSPTQYGFVTNRTVHDALDVFHGLQRLVQQEVLSHTAVAVLLDFEKAYDTLDRPFLMRVLERLGFPPLFRQAVEQMHLATTAEYIANGDVSDKQAILNGIRQGCPLAPTLFILAIDTLYEAIAASVSVPGLSLPSGVEVGAVGFADDTTVFLESIENTAELSVLLTRFAVASGLRVNEGKCKIVSLHPMISIKPEVQTLYPISKNSEMTRLLGAQVASKLRLQDVWDLTYQQVRT